MASKRAHINAKRSERRRNLAERLELARRDADEWCGEEHSAKRTKPTRAPYLQEAKEESESDLEPSAGAADAEPGAVEEAANLEPGEKDAEHRRQDEQIDSSEEGEDASTWMERGRAAKMAASSRRGSPRQAVQLRSAVELRRKASKIKLEEPPWRSASSQGFEQGFEDGPLAGVRDVVPRWKVEEKLQRERAGQNQPYSDVLLGKVATQLLRWGRSDLQAEGGTTKTIKLVGWKAGAWVTIEHLAETMGVLPKQLSKDVLETCGKHGQRLLVQERQGGLGPQVKANWAER